MGEANAPEEIAPGATAAPVDGAARARGDGDSNSGAHAVQVVQDDDTEAPTPLEYNISSMPADYTLETLHQKWRSGDIEIPRLQRGYVWTPLQASRLIESFMMGLPVPPVYLAEGDGEGSVVIDGMQRLLTVFAYLDGRYPEGGAQGGGRFRITGINKRSRLYGKTFWDLGDNDQRLLKGAILRATIVMTNGPAGGDDSAMSEVFERLNTGGTLLAAQEIRSCLYAGDLGDMIRGMNADKDWRDILGKPRPDPRMKDAEMILRYMALFHAGDGYAPPMKAFLSGFMAGHKNPGRKFMDRERARFAGICRDVRGALGSGPFSNERGQVRMPLFDSVFVAFARSGGRRPADLGERFGRLQSDEEFSRCAGEATASAAAVRGRLRLAREILFG